jgi:hypothetical protein
MYNIPYQLKIPREMYMKDYHIEDISGIIFKFYSNRNRFSWKDNISNMCAANTNCGVRDGDIDGLERLLSAGVTP